MKIPGKKIECASAVLTLCFLVFAPVSAQVYELTQTAIAGGGMSNGTGGAFSLDSTTGQAAASGPLSGLPYQMTVGFWNYQPLRPTAAGVSISGRVMTATGRGIVNVRLVLSASSGESLYAQTGSFGYFKFDDVPAGNTYILTIHAKRFVFAQPTRVINLTDELTDVNFTSEP